MIGSLLSALVAVAFLGLGAGAAVAPQALSENYGLPATSATEIAYVRALGARDAVLGFVLLWFAATRARGGLETTVAFSTLVGASDFAIVLAARGPAARKNLVIHGGGVVGLLAVWRVLRSGR